MTSIFRFILYSILFYFAFSIVRKVLGFLFGSSKPIQNDYNRESTVFNESMYTKRTTKPDIRDIEDAKFIDLPTEEEKK